MKHSKQSFSAKDDRENMKDPSHSQAGAPKTDSADWVNDVDDLPVPPYELIHLVVGPSNARDFVKSGKEVANRCVVDALRKNGLTMSDFRAILDFGCGCGRLIRHWPQLTGARLYGTDYNAELIEWCRANLPFAEFQVNQIEPPLSYPDRRFDLIFAGSVFTHFTEQLQFRWLKEMWRILAPGGHLLLTTRGDHYAAELPTKLRRRYDAGEFVAVNEGKAGTNTCGAYHSLAYVRRRLARDYDIVDFIPKGWDTQDIVLLRKPVKQSWLRRINSHFVGDEV